MHNTFHNKEMCAVLVVIASHPFLYINQEWKEQNDTQDF